jgi:hypothetical protein
MRQFLSSFLCEQEAAESISRAKLGIRLTARYKEETAVCMSCHLVLRGLFQRVALIRLSKILAAHGIEISFC